jgi:hypothetical protein
LICISVATRVLHQQKNKMKGHFAAVIFTLFCRYSIHAFAPRAGILQHTRSVNLQGQVTIRQIFSKLHESRLDEKTVSTSKSDVTDEITANQQSGFNYGDFAKQNPFLNNLGIASAKTLAADLLAQVVIAQTPIADIDWQRSFLFGTFGLIYSGGFQYLYQVQVFKKLFDVDAFTSQPWAEKLKDGPGLKALAAQTAVDLTVLTLIYLPSFYIFKAGVFSGSSTDLSTWVSSGFDTYKQNFAKDEFDLIRVWLPADLVCFSVPLYLRLPARHVGKSYTEHNCN